MSYTILAHVTTGDLATASLHNALLDDVAILKIMIDDNGILTYNAPRVLSGSAGLTATDKVVFCNATLSVSLLTPSGNAGKFVYVKNIGVGTVTVNVSGGVINIDSATTLTLNANDAGLFYCDGTQWWILGRK